MTKARSSADFAAGGFYAGKNAIINGNFGIWQRGSSFTPTTGQVYTVDRFLTLRDGTGATVTVSRQAFTPNTAGDPTGAVNGSNYFYRQAQSVAGSGGTYNLMEQRIEGAIFAGQTVTFSFWAKAAASLTLPQIDYEYTVGGTNTSANVTSNIAVTTSWQRFSYTFTMPTYSGYTPNNTSDFFGIRIWFPSNATFTFDTWGWQLELGSTATPFETATGTIQGELAACQRYYFRNTGSNLYLGSGGIAGDTTNAYVQVKHPTTMRIAPTVSDVSLLKLQIISDIRNINSASIVGSSPDISIFICTVSSGLVATTQSYMLQTQANAAAYLGISAEL
jgi:hypothetical protein